MNIVHNSDHAASPSATTLLNKKANRRNESGYAYVMALAMVLTVIVGSQVILRNLVTESRSQHEQEMIWRGNQYARAIRLYYRKTGHFPQTQDDLVTGAPGIHFIRSEAVTDPINKSDGAWRFIYTNASGAIIGSVKYGSLQQMALMDMNGGVMPGAPQTGTGSTTNSSQNSSTDNGNGAPTSTSTAPGTTPTTTNTSTNGSSTTAAPGASTLGVMGQPTALLAPTQPTGPVDGPVFGGQLIGVGSTVDRASVRVYKGGTKYNQWEFIWNPVEEQAMAMQQGLSGGGQQGTPGLGLGGLPLGAIPGTTNGTGGATAPTNSTNGTDNGGANPPAGSNNPTNPTQ